MIKLICRSEVVKMKLLYATSNYTKINNMKRILENTDIEIITPKDLSIFIEVEEDGITATDNAIKKAQAYYNVTNMPTIAADVSFYVDNLEAERQPGLYVRRVKGKVLTDEEMLNYYQSLATSIGGSTTAYYIKALAIIYNNKLSTIELEDSKFILTDKASSNIHPGYPLDSLSIDIKTNKYYADMTKEEAKELNSYLDIQCANFIIENLK